MKLRYMLIVLTLTLSACNISVTSFPAASGPTVEAPTEIPPTPVPDTPAPPTIDAPAVESPSMFEVQFLNELGHRVQDFGTNSEEAVDYPDFAHAVARSVSNGTSDVGIVIDGAGVGSAMTANKVPGVRAAACYSVAVARNSREHNGANVLSLGSKTINSKEMREIVAAWLSTELTEDRHRKRVSKIDAIQKQYQRQ